MMRETEKLSKIVGGVKLDGQQTNSLVIYPSIFLLGSDMPLATSLPLSRFSGSTPPTPPKK